MTLDTSRFKYLQIAQDADRLLIRLHLPASTMGSRRKVARAAERLFLKRLERLAKAEPNGMFSLPLAPAAPRELAKLDEGISTLIDAPLSGRIVEKMLDISGNERRRWTRDGRLPHCAKVVTGRSEHVFAVSLYSADLVEELANDRARIAAWRSHDARAEQ